jgi:hypothetical protein
MSDRTKGPWRRDPKRSMRIVAGHDDTVASVGSQASLADEWEANAAAIVLWENHFDELVKALEEAKRQLEEYELAATGEHYNSLQINAILAKVTP